MLTAEGTETAESGKRGLIVSSADWRLPQLILSNERREKLRPQRLVRRMERSQTGVTLPLPEVAGVTVNTRTGSGRTGCVSEGTACLQFVSGR